jgi:predicted CopG family antitoxin
LQKSKTITVEDEVYEGLHRVIGARRISRFLNDLARPHVTARDLVEGYRAMTADEEYEREAHEWIEHLAGDVADERIGRLDGAKDDTEATAPG